MPDDKEKADATPAAKTPLLLMILVVLNLGATGYAGVKVTFPPPRPPTPMVVEEAVETDEPGPILEWEKPFVVNLNEPQGGRYLKVQLSVEVADDDALSALNKATQIARDDLLRYLSGLTVADAMGEESKTKIHDTIVERLDKILGGGERVRRVLFAEFVIQ